MLLPDPLLQPDATTRVSAAQRAVNNPGVGRPRDKTPDAEADLAGHESGRGGGVQTVAVDGSATLNINLRASDGLKVSSSECLIGRVLLNRGSSSTGES